MHHEDSSDYIDGISNYCDRWCERCQFTTRCRAFAIGQEFTDEQRDAANPAFVQILKNIFAEAKGMLVEKAEEFGIDPYALSDEEFEEIKERQEKFIDGSELTKLAAQYAAGAGKALETRAEWLNAASADEGAVSEAIDVLYRYQYFIAAKIHRGLQGMLDVDGFEDAGEIEDPQSDANGSIKICLVAIERSMLAWTYLLDAENAENIRPLIKLLEKIKSMVEEKFPNARDFIRPGFDEIDAVM